MKHGLTWGLLIATKDRLEPLKICVELAIAQTRPPVEVIVADASAGCEYHAAAIAKIVQGRPETRLVYRQAALPSVTVQRNQAVKEARADVVFMIDDDSFMFPDCAEEIMKIYEADTRQEVVGIQATETSRMPGVTFTGARKKNVDIWRASEASPMLNWIFSKVFMMGMTEVFLPYDGTFSSRSVPAELQSMNVASAQLFGGFRMTYRRKSVLAAPFDSVLRYYCPGEDFDASYRISRLGTLLTAKNAFIHHYCSAAGRLSRQQVAYLWSLNQAVLLRRYSPDQNWVRRAYNRHMVHRIASDILKDLLMRRLSLPQTRGSIQARVAARQVFRMSPRALEEWYPAKQEKIVKSQGTMGVSSNL